MIDSLQIIKDTIQTAIENGGTLNNTESNDFNLWLLISIAEAVVILILFYKNKSIKKENFITNNFKELKTAKNAEIDMNDLMDSINSSKALYKKLSRVCHPDKFQDEILKETADKIFQEISRHKRNHKKLLELKLRAENELSINFK